MEYIIIFILLLSIIYIYNLILTKKNIENFEETDKDNTEDEEEQYIEVSEIKSLNNNDENEQTYINQLRNLSKKVLLNNNKNQENYLNEYIKIQNEYSDKYNKTITENDYSDGHLNTGICTWGSAGIPILSGIFRPMCKVKDNSTKCYKRSEDFNKICKKNLGNNEDYDDGKPSQLVTGQKEIYGGGCKSKLLDSKARAVCELGWEKSSKIPINSTKCHFDSDNFENHCIKYAGNNKNWDTGITSDYVFGVKNTNNNGCSWGTKRAECALGYYNNTKLRENSTNCNKPSSDFNALCRKYAGNNQNSKPSKETPSQKIWGVYKTYIGGCPGNKKRAECKKGYSNKIKIKDNSTDCYDWNDDFNKHCKSTYGENWGLVSKYGGGCYYGQGRGECEDLNNVPVGTIKETGCGLLDHIDSSWCKKEFGFKWKFSEKTSSPDCVEKQGVAKCKKISI